MFVLYEGDTYMEKKYDIGLLLFVGIVGGCIGGMMSGIVIEALRKQPCPPPIPPRPRYHPGKKVKRA